MALNGQQRFLVSVLSGLLIVTLSSAPGSAAGPGPSLKGVSDSRPMSAFISSRDSVLQGRTRFYFDAGSSQLFYRDVYLDLIGKPSRLNVFGRYVLSSSGQEVLRAEDGSVVAQAIAASSHPKYGTAFVLDSGWIATRRAGAGQLELLSILPEGERLSLQSVLQFKPSNESDNLDVLYFNHQLQNGAMIRVELRNPSWRNWEELRGLDQRTVRLRGTLRFNTQLQDWHELMETDEAAAKAVWKRLYANTDIYLDTAGTEAIFIVDELAPVAR